MYMTTKQFLASCAKATFALAAVVMMSAVLTSCSKDNDDNGPTTLPEPKANTVVIDGKEATIEKAQFKKVSPSSTIYAVAFTLSGTPQKELVLGLDDTYHMDGKPIDLTTKEGKMIDKLYWGVVYTVDGKKLIDASGSPKETQKPVFTTGTLTVSKTRQGTINIVLANGRVNDVNGKERTLTLNYEETLKTKD